MGLIVSQDSDAPLSQGDILKGVTLHATKVETENPVALKSGCGHALVLSRNCNAVRADVITVAQVVEYAAGAFPNLAGSGLDQARRALASLRDGDGSPDSFYLGCLPDRTPRRAHAKLDLVSALQLPKDEKSRLSWIASHRVGALSDEHRRHLHISLLVAFGREGFHDFVSWPDEDLQLIIVAGTNELRQKEISQAQQIPALHANPVDSAKTEKKLGEAEAGAEKLRAQLQPYLDEWNRRHPDIDPLKYLPAAMTESSR